MLTTNVNDPDLNKLDTVRNDGQYKKYVILPSEEREKGFVRPVRDKYIHKGIKPVGSLRELTKEEKIRYEKYDYAAFEKYSDTESPLTGRFWTKEQLESGCNKETSMGIALSETYARDPKFYGSTYCAHCQKHFPVKEFVWSEDGEIVGS